jgi:uncharacterized membrane protein
MSNSELRALARERLSGNWGMAVLFSFLFGALSSVCGFVPFVGVIGTLLIIGPLTFGNAKFFLRLMRKQTPQVEDLFSGFELFSTTVVTNLLMMIYIFLWSLLFIIPGIIASLSYSQVFFILNDHPELTPSEVLIKSKAIMDGYKAKYFLLSLSFIGWGILSIFTLCIGYLFLIPYMQVSFANFYQDISKNSNAK